MSPPSPFDLEVTDLETSLGYICHLGLYTTQNNAREKGNKNSHLLLSSAAGTYVIQFTIMQIALIWGKIQ